MGDIGKRRGVLSGDKIAGWVGIGVGAGLELGLVYRGI